ncbi:hypothetical protein TorRG33x02_238800 [Trema orientale]|uniref:Uncharacterized protein n=1 Tax=Trema orientale TaxID=63057 RepID=A0A2P5DYF9_TREOI|nr:hypothetical protein TorRG33x02_238800 [Trema orientale]
MEIELRCVEIEIDESLSRLGSFFTIFFTPNSFSRSDHGFGSGHVAAIYGVPRFVVHSGRRDDLLRGFGFRFDWYTAW